MKICLIDNYDSFTYNLEHQLRSFDLAVDVVRNDETSIEALTAIAVKASIEVSSLRTTSTAKSKERNWCSRLYVKES